MDDGGSAFPSECLDGMSLLDYFAAHAPAGITVNHKHVSSIDEDAAARYEWAEGMILQKRKKELIDGD